MATPAYGEVSLMRLSVSTYAGVGRVPTARVSTVTMRRSATAVALASLRTPSHLTKLKVLVAANEREDWPDGPYTLHFYRRRTQGAEEYDTPAKAESAAESMAEYGSGAPDKITDRHGRTVHEF